MSRRSRGRRVHDAGLENSVNNKLHPHQKEELAELAVAAMRERGLQPEFSGPALQQLRAIDGPGTADGADIADLSGLL